MLVGYAEWESDSVRMWDPTTCRVMVTWDIIWLKCWHYQQVATSRVIIKTWRGTAYAAGDWQLWGHRHSQYLECRRQNMTCGWAQLLLARAEGQGAIYYQTHPQWWQWWDIFKKNMALAVFNCHVPLNVQPFVTVHDQALSGEAVRGWFFTQTCYRVSINYLIVSCNVFIHFGTHTKTVYPLSVVK